MAHFVIAFVVSSIFIAMLGGLSRSRFGQGLAFWICLISAGLSVCIFSAALLLHCLFTAPLAAVCYFRGSKPRVLVIGSCVAMALSYGLMLSMGLKQLWTLQDLRVRFPEVSVADRLKYELKAISTDDDSTKNPIMLPAEVERRLREHEIGHGASSARHWMLERLHNRMYDDFVLASGFGESRMQRVRQEYIELPLPSPLQAPGTIPYESPLPGQGIPLASEVPEGSALLQMHQEGLESFLDQSRIGFVRDRDHVAGFQSHAFAIVPETTAGTESSKTTWQIARLELISLLKHKTPVAYVSRDLPNMEELKTAAIRPLDTFETSSLKKLRTAEDLVIDEQPRFIRMIGSVRAGNDCLACHNVQRGELLGAFSYELAPVPQPR